MNKRVKIINCKHKEFIGQEFNVIDEYLSPLNHRVYRIDAENPQHPNIPVWVKSENVQVVIK